MRALFVYKFLTLGGVEAVLKTRLQSLPQMGVDARAWFLRDGPGREMLSAVSDRYHIGGIDDLARFLEAWRPNIVASIDTEEIFGIVSRNPGVSGLVIEVHSPYKENRAYLHHIGGLNVEAFLVPSEHQRKIVERTTGSSVPIEVAPNPLDGRFFRDPGEVGENLPFQALAWIGRLDALKNWKGILHIGQILKQGGKRFELWIVDGGSVRQAEKLLYRELRRKDLLGHTRWIKQLSHSKMPALFDLVRHSGGLVVSTSLDESFGMTIAEAMSRGCAVIVPNHGPFREFVADGDTGLLYKHKSMQAAAEKAQFLMANADRRHKIGVNARNSVLQTFAPEVALSELVRILRQIINRRRSQ